MNFPGIQSGDKSAALQTLRASRTPAKFAKRLECGRLQRRSGNATNFTSSASVKGTIHFGTPLNLLSLSFT